MTIPVITEKPARQPTGTDERGPRRIRKFDIHASSKQAAYNLLGAGDETVPGHIRGTVYQEPQTGEVIDPALVVQEFTDRAHPPAPAIEGGKGLYEITAHFAYSRSSYREPALPALGDDETPIPVYRIERTDVSVPIDHDVDGQPIVNVLGDPIDPPLTDTEARETLVMEWLVLGDDWLSVYVDFRVYRNRVNSAEFKGAPIGCLLCVDLDVLETRLPRKGGQLWFRIIAKFEYREPQTLFGETPDEVTYPGWQEVVLNRGRRAKYFPVEGDPAFEIRVVVDSRGNQVPDPILLTEIGTPHDPEVWGAPHILTFWRKKMIDFNDMV